MLLLPSLLGSQSSSRLAFFVWWLVVMVAARPAATIVHEIGHAWACLVLGAKVRAIYLGNDAPGPPRFTLGRLTVTLTWNFGGRVEHDDTRSAVRNAIITAAGPLANLIVAGTLAVALVAASSTNGYVLGLVCLMAGIGVSNLMPYRAPSGRPTDGARLLGLVGGKFAEAVAPPTRTRRAFLLASQGVPPEVRQELADMARSPYGSPQPERTTRWLAAYYRGEPLAQLAAGVIGRELRKERRLRELLTLHAGWPVPAGQLAPGLIEATHTLAWEVLLLPGVPREVADRAVTRVSWVLDNAEFEPGNDNLYREAVQHTLALGKLRQGRFGEAEQWCAPILARQTLNSANRATVLATIALARKAQGLPYEQLAAEAVSLDPTADLVQEASASLHSQYR
jgi:hypothetical protein